MSVSPVYAAPGGTVEQVRVPAHTTHRLTTTDGWSFWRVRTGCVRVQRGDFTAYLQADAAEILASFIFDTNKGGWGPS